MAKAKSTEHSKPIPKRKKLSKRKKKANIARKERAKNPLFR